MTKKKITQNTAHIFSKHKIDSQPVSQPVPQKRNNSPPQKKKNYVPYRIGGYDRVCSRRDAQLCMKIRLTAVFVTKPPATDVHFFPAVGMRLKKAGEGGKMEERIKGRRRREAGGENR